MSDNIYADSPTRWPRLDFLPAFLWVIWRDLTWCRSKRFEWMWKMRELKCRDFRMAVIRANRVADQSANGADDNIPKEWGLALLAEWGVLDSSSASRRR